MAKGRKKSTDIPEYILSNVETYPKTIVHKTMEQFGCSRATVSHYIQDLVDNKHLFTEGNTRARIYKLAPISSEYFSVRLMRDMAEHTVWRYRLLPHLTGVAQNIIDICQYGFTEMLNNAVDHSVSMSATVFLERTHTTIRIMVDDQGVGIFNKIQHDFGLSDPRSALLELSKGKLTSDKTRHAGEGIFFTSRMFDTFSITSYDLYYSRSRTRGNEWLIESRSQESTRHGTCIWMSVSTKATWTTHDVFEQYRNDNIGFRKTHVPILLARYPGEQLVSRSQAKRILARFNDFSEVMLDFAEVATIGQPFADEIFRVFPMSNPEIGLIAINTTPEVQAMIDYVKTSYVDDTIQYNLLTDLPDEQP